MNYFWLERNINYIFDTISNWQHQEAVETFSITIQDFITQVKDHKNIIIFLYDFIWNFLLYYNDGLHSITKVAPYREMMNISDMELMKKKRKAPSKGD